MSQCKKFWPVWMSRIAKAWARGRQLGGQDGKKGSEPKHEYAMGQDVVSALQVLFVSLTTMCLLFVTGPSAICEPGPSTMWEHGHHLHFRACAHNDYRHVWAHMWKEAWQGIVYQCFSQAAYCKSAHPYSCGLQRVRSWLAKLITRQLAQDLLLRYSAPMCKYGWMLGAQNMIWFMSTFKPKPSSSISDTLHLYPHLSCQTWESSTDQ